jgi:membrane-associated protein
MASARFLCYNVVGAVVWVLIFAVAGYFLGSIPIIKNNIKLVFLLIIVVSVLPIMIEVLKHKAEARKAKEKSES